MRLQFIVASKGAALERPSVMLGPIVIVVVVTTIISPILLKLAFSDKNNNIALNPDGK